MLSQGLRSTIRRLLVVPHPYICTQVSLKVLTAFLRSALRFSLRWRSFSLKRSVCDCKIPVCSALVCTVLDSAIAVVPTVDVSALGPAASDFAVLDCSALDSCSAVVCPAAVCSAVDCSSLGFSFLDSVTSGSFHFGSLAIPEVTLATGLRKIWGLNALVSASPIKTITR